MAAGTTTQRIALVTGSNQGIGRALVDDLATRWTPADVVLLTGRNLERVEEAAKELNDSPTTRATIVGRRLDVSDADAVAAFAATVQEQHGGIEVVISNAGARITPDRSQQEQADEFIEVANGGTQAVLRSFGPIIKPGGRLIVVASGLGTLGNLDEHLHPLFDNATLDEIEAVVADWRAAVLAGTAKDAGWPEWINLPSKVAQVAAVRALARERREADLRADILLATVCPGLVDTAASRPWFADFSDARTPAKAAAVLLDFILAEPLDPALYGELVRDGKVLPWYSGGADEPATTSTN